MNKALTLRIARAFLSLSIAGFIIGFFFPYDLYLAIFLFLLLVFRIYQESDKNLFSTNGKILIAGTVLSGLLGTFAEIWGISNNYWEYHNLDNNRHFPYWLPFAWALTFSFFYKLERDILKITNTISLKSKLIFVVLVSAIFPTWGEIITINLGVWTYYWDYQFFGVPLLAIFLLVIFHTFIFILFTLICKKYKIFNPVFNFVLTK